ncbi:MAG: DUF7093 family protein [Halobacteriota archaeon]
MGLRCLLGHDFDSPEVEHEREEDGNEMVVTIREVKTCIRCGEQQVVSENKEVTSIRTAEEVGLEDAGESVDEAELGSTDATGDVDVDGDAASDGDASGVDDETDDHEFEPPTSAAEDDGVILEDEEPPERDYGEWPDAGPHGDEATAGATGADGSGQAETPWPEHETGASRPEDGEQTVRAWPEHTAEDEGYDAAPGGDEDVEVAFGGGLTPEVEGGTPAQEDVEFIDNSTDAGDLGASTDGSEVVEDAGDDIVEDAGDDIVEDAGDDIVEDAGDDVGFVRAPTDEDAGAQAITTSPTTTTTRRPAPSGATEFFCPNCGHSRPVGQSSLRPGDICPECRRGYIAERER